jgi:hypothetical protein
MKKKNVTRFIPLLCTAIFLAGCIDVAYKYDIESGYDDHTATESTATEEEQEGIDVSMYNHARIFPGLVDTLTERRVADTLISIDLSRRYLAPNVLKAMHTPEPIYSTGLYAGAGEQITIEIEGNIMGLSVQIGSHSDDLGDGALLRQPLVYTRKALYEGVNYVRNSMGGYIWILRAPHVSGPADYTIRIGGAYAAPDFIRDKTNPDEWSRKIRSTTVPWLELRGERVAFSVSRVRMEEQLLQNPNFAAEMNSVLQIWDEDLLTNGYYAYYALTPGGSPDVFRAPEFPERWVMDVQLVNNLYMRWQGQPIASLNTTSIVEQLTDLKTVSQGRSLTALTAIGNNYTLSSSYWGADYATIGLLMPYMKILSSQFQPGNEFPELFANEDKSVYETALAYAASDSIKLPARDAVTKDAGGKAYQTFRLLPLLQLGVETDWEFYQDLNRTIKEGELVAGGINNLALAATRYMNRDLNPFFENWGIWLPENIRHTLSTYPPLETEIWRTDPFSDTPTAAVQYDPDEHIFRHSRQNWRVAAFDAYYTDNWYMGTSYGGPNPPTHIFDNVLATHWHSDYGNNIVMTLPYYIIIDMLQEIDIDGIYTAHYDGGRPIRKLLIQGSNEVIDNLDDSNIVWTDIAQIRPEEEGIQPGDNIVSGYMRTQGNQKNQFYEFVNPVRYRNLRLVIQECSSGFADMAEFGTYLKPKK